MTAPTLTITYKTKYFTRHTRGEWGNWGAFAVIKADGAVVTWGCSLTGGDVTPVEYEHIVDFSEVADLLNGTIDAMQIFSTSDAFAALRSDGSVVTWGDALSGGGYSGLQLDGTIDVVEVFSTGGAFAALRSDGSVVSWGGLLEHWVIDGTYYPVYNLLSNMPTDQLDGTIDVVDIFTTSSAFAALRSDGSVVTWGKEQDGGDSSAVADRLDGSIETTQIYSTLSAFAALRSDGSVVTWGSEHSGGDSSAVADYLDGTIDVTRIFSTGMAFAALHSDGSVVTWGDPEYGGDNSAVADQLDGTIDVTEIVSTTFAFAALRSDGSVVTWGKEQDGGDSSAVADYLDGTIDVTRIFSTGMAFAALHSDGSVVTWGKTGYGGDSSTVADQLDGTIDVVEIFSTGKAFAALRSDGSVVTWGDTRAGGDSSTVTDQLDGSIDVTSIFSTDEAFAALRRDGSVVTWGNGGWGGDSSAVADLLTSDVVWAANIYTDDTFKVVDTIPSLEAEEIFTGHGGVYAGKIGLLADWAKAAYHLGDWETTGDNTRINDVADSGGAVGSGRHADDVFTELLSSGEWSPLDLTLALPSKMYLKQKVTASDLGVVTSWSTTDSTPEEYVPGTVEDNAPPLNDYVYGTITNGYSGGLYTFGNAAALVTRCADSLVLSFRGTNDNRSIDADCGTPNTNDTVDNAYRPDVGDWNAMVDHYDNLDPLISALDQYINTHADIKHVYVTGHSLGGAMALRFMNDHENTLNTHYEAVTFASPSYFKFSQNYDERITNIEIQDDPVPELFNLFNPQGLILYFIGDGTLDGYEINHSMEYYRDISWNIDNETWEYLLSRDKETEILLSAKRLVSNGKEQFIVSAGEDLLNASTAESALDGVQANRGIDIIYGGAGNDRLVGDNSSEILQGGLGADVLIGGAGRDTLIGGLGNDTYYVDTRLDSISESSISVTEIDTVVSPISWTLGENLEKLILNGTAAINGKGNSLANTLVGNSGANTLNGGGGVDIMIGGTGNDTYFVDDAADITSETSALVTEIDLVVSSVSRTLGANLEKLVLSGTSAINGTGNSLHNTLVGNSGANVLNGGGGVDIMIGGTGNDTYFIDDAADITFETSALVTEIDLVVSSVSRTLGANLEKLVLSGTSAINGTGNSVANTLVGNSGANALNGGGGVDTMIGGTGNDTYFVDNIDDLTSETSALATEIDTVISSVTWKLGANMEKLILTGMSAISGTGNTLNNTLVGNSGANVLNGGTGNDTVNGGMGNDSIYGNLGIDTLTGGTGADFFIFNSNLNAATNRDIITDFRATDDTIQLDRTIFTKLNNPGKLSPNSFRSSNTGTALDSNDYLLYNTITGSLYYDPDGNGAVAAIQFANLPTKSALTSDDFIVIA